MGTPGKLDVQHCLALQRYIIGNRPRTMLRVSDSPAGLPVLQTKALQEWPPRKGLLQTLTVTGLHQKVMVLRQKHFVVGRADRSL